ncbi:MAG: methyltransferase domain-containing protein [Acidimicrobiia bacterium]
MDNHAGGRPSRVPTEQEIRERFADIGYTAMHARRFAYTVETVASLDLPPDPRVLDVGPSPLTTLLAESLGVPVDTLGLDSLGFAAPASRHYEFDLNDSQYEEKWITVDEPYDLVVMGEIIEHMHTSPARVLAFVRSLLVPGGLLLLGTPNGVSFGRRFHILAGRNPYHLINEDPTDPLHFREYTRQEMESYIEGAGFEIVRSEMVSLIDSRGRTGKNRLVGNVQNRVYRHLPPSLRDSILVVARRAG